MNCYNVRMHLEKMVTGEISSLLARQLQEHLRTCPGCREEYQEMKRALEMFEQESQTTANIHFSPVWRQRVRQEALKNEAGRRSFFSIFKTNTLVPALGVLAILVVFGVFNVYHRFTPRVTIEPLIKEYSPAMSSTIGIPLVAKFTGDRTTKDITYHWVAEYGRFLSWDGTVTELGADILTQKNEIYWSIDPKEKRTVSSFNIYLQVEASRTGNMIAQAMLKLEMDEDGFFLVRN